MPQFVFEGRRQGSGEVVRGVREATSYLTLGQDLLSEGTLLTHYELRQSRPVRRSLLRLRLERVSAIERILFARYFGMMLRAGLDIKRSLGTLREQSRSPAMRTALASIYQDIERGKTLADSMAVFPGVFPSLFISFVRVGESTGRLQESLEVLAEQLKKDYDLRRAVHGALLYPAVIVAAMGAVGVAMLVFVVPKLAEVFTDLNTQLPFTTRLLLAVGSFVSGYWYLVLIAVGLLGLGAVVLWRLPPVRAVFMRLCLSIPILNSIIIKVNVARFSRSLSSLIHSGMAFIESLRVLSENMPHPTYAAVFRQSQEHVKQGKPLSEFLSQHRRLFPPLITSVIRVGEETGQLDAVLGEIAVFYEADVDQTMKNLSSLLEPVLMVLIGLAVGALAVSIISPIYSLVNIL